MTYSNIKLPAPIKFKGRWVDRVVVLEAPIRLYPRITKVRAKSLRKRGIKFFIQTRYYLGRKRVK